MPKRTVSLILPTGTILIVASWAALEWLRPRADLGYEAPTWIGLFEGMAKEELASVAISFATPVLILLGLRFHRLSLLPLLPAAAVAAILIGELVRYHATIGSLPLPLWVVNLASAAAVVGLAAVSSGICGLLVTRRHGQSGTTS
ncbi:hypothetical protein [Brevundimonas sp.]|uniref:hypothetical protein n=1 Tax=Brevundimonas sp. TaxID=1871086 RepID=UPI002D6827D0|nr:hypothetical protein [Brevundimonas sp.]HYC97057.1 hypothetical protein [Brevundimonas sp.]